MGGGCPLSVFLGLLLLYKDICVEFSFEASVLHGRWHGKRNVSDERVQVMCESGVVNMFYIIFLRQIMDKVTMSHCIVVLFTYHCAFIDILSILFWGTCILCMCVFDTELHTHCLIILMNKVFKVHLSL